MTAAEDLWALANRARAGDLAAMRELHFPQRAAPETYEQWVEFYRDEFARLKFCQIAGPELMKLLNAHKPPRKPAPPRPGGIDFTRINDLALDRLHDLLEIILPDGHEGASDGRWCWVGWHTLRPEPVHVCMMIGYWNEPNTGRTGRDLVSLYSYLFGVSNGRGAHLLMDWLGADWINHAA